MIPAAWRDPGAAPEEEDEEEKEAAAVLCLLGEAEENRECIHVELLGRKTGLRELLPSWINLEHPGWDVGCEGEEFLQAGQCPWGLPRGMEMFIPRFSPREAPLSEHRAGSFAVAAQLSLPWLPYVFLGMFFHAPFAPFFAKRDESPRSRFQSWVRSTVKTPLAVTGKWESARFWGVLENTRASLGSQELPWIPVGIPKYKLFPG